MTFAISVIVLSSIVVAAVRGGQIGSAEIVTELTLRLMARLRRSGTRGIVMGTLRK
jgi:hypothetical protein